MPRLPVNSLAHRPTFARIHIQRFKTNIKRIQEQIGPERGIMAVVKADAYGHGMLPLARAAVEAGAKWLGVATLDEAMALKEAGLELPTLVLAPVQPEAFEAAVMAEIRVGIGSLDGARALAEAAVKAGKPALAHLKIDTGMGRFGIWHEDIAVAAPQLSAFEGIRWEGVMTHFSESDAADPTYTEWQINYFERARSVCSGAGLNFEIAHTANSGAVLQHPDSWYDLVRPGVMLYGMMPDPETERTVDVEPVMSLMTAVAELRDVGEGRYISYGRTYRTPRPMRIALLPVGYGDGYSRMLSNRGEVVLRGHRAPIIGRVCMDQVMIDVSDIPGVSIGDPVLLWGREPDAVLTAEEVAAWRNTITYEITCNLTPRVPRVYD